MKQIKTFGTIVLTLLACALLVASLSAPAAAAPPSPGAIVGVSTRTFALTKVITGNTQTTFTASPLLSRGIDLSKTTGYYLADSFVTADVNGGSSLIAVPQVSADAVNWTALPYTSTLSADSTDLQQFTTAGEYLRYSLTTTGTITITIRITLKNVGG
jgi:hypothetical protein